MALRRKISIAALLTVVASVGALYMYLAVSSDPGCFWRTVSNARVTSSGESVSDARVYRRPNGTLLVDLGSGSWYRYDAAENSVWLCNRPRIVAFPGYSYVRGFDGAWCPCVAMGTAKTEVPANVEVGPGTLSFTSIDADRIRVAW